MGGGRPSSWPVGSQTMKWCAGLCRRGGVPDPWGGRRRRGQPPAAARAAGGSGDATRKLRVCIRVTRQGPDRALQN